MIKEHFKIAWRNLVKNKTLSFINIGGLSVGMAVAMLIGLWIWDELSFNTYHRNYDRIAQVMLKQIQNDNINIDIGIPAGLGAALRENYGNDFRYIVMSSLRSRHVLAAGEKKISSLGSFMEADGPKLFTFKMIAGTDNSLGEPSSILISESLSKILFGDAQCIGKIVMMDNKTSFKVTGVYEDLPSTSSLNMDKASFTGPWSDFSANVLPNWVFNAWGWDCAQLFVQINDHGDMAKASQKIKNVIYSKANDGDKKSKPELLLNRMSKWHLYQYKDGVQVWGKMQYVWLFGIIGVIVLLLACINFMNLSTARSEKRAKEVGIRKAIGSLRSQLIQQFYCESILVAVLSFMLSVLLVMAAIPWFNEVSNKEISILWSDPIFWSVCLGVTFFTGLIAGSYPAFYLSSFKPVKVIKGTFKAGPLAAIPRKVLVVVQFSVCMVLIVATIVVFKQIEFSEGRPVGYNKDRLVIIRMVNDDLHRQFDAFRNDLLRSGAIAEIAESTDPITGNGNNVRGLQWRGKDPGLSDNFGFVGVTPEYGATIGWQIVAGRDFSRQFLSDSTSMILNEAAVQYMGLKKPVGETVTMSNNNYTVIGVVKNMVMNSPYEPVNQTIFTINKDMGRVLTVRIRSNANVHQALGKIEEAFKNYSPSIPFSYKFVDEEYAKKFEAEELVGKLARLFSALAIFIGCLGLFGMASFIAEQRTKEIGVRKILGASVLDLWKLLSREFVIMVLIALLIATPLAFYFMNNWLQNYQYRTNLSWWIFAAAGAGVLLITISTVSFRSIKAARANPIKSLRTE